MASEYLETTVCRRCKHVFKRSVVGCGDYDRPGKPPEVYSCEVCTSESYKKWQATERQLAAAEARVKVLHDALGKYSCQSMKQSMKHDLERVRQWAKDKIATGNEPPWAWYQYMKLVETLDAILAGMQAVRLVDDNYPRDDPPQLPI